MLRFKHIFIVTLSILTVFSSIAPLSLAITGVDKETLKAAQQYEKFLMEKSKEDPGALEFKEQFSSLTWEKKKKFLGYINNPKIIEEILSVSVPENSTLKLYNGDIEIISTTKNTIQNLDDKKIAERESIFSRITSFFVVDTFAVSPKISRRVEYSKMFKFLGLDFMRIYAYINYIAQGISVVSIQNSNGALTLYYSPFNAKRTSKDHYIATRRAHLKIEWAIGVPLISSKYVGRINTNPKRLHLIGDHMGKSVAAFSNL